MNKVIITGVTGFIGGSVARKLLDDGVFVYGVCRDTAKLDELKKYDNFTPIIASFADYGRLSEKIQDKEIDIFYHFSWGGGSC